MNDRRCAFVMLAAFLGLLSSTSWSQIGSEKEDNKVFQAYRASMAKLKEGKAFFLKGNYDRAEKKLKECLTVFPENPDAHYLIAQIVLNRGDVDAALSSIERAESSFMETRKFYGFYHQERMVDLRDQKARVEESIKKWEDSMTEYEGSTPCCLTPAVTSTMESQIRQERILLGRIEQELQDPVPENPPVPARYHYVHGNTLFKFKRFQEAAGEYLETIRLDPHHEFAFNNVASIYYGIGQFQKALDFLLQAEANGVKVNAVFKKSLEDKLANR